MTVRHATIEQARGALKSLAEVACDKGGSVSDLFEDKCTDFRDAVHDLNRDLRKRTHRTMREVTRMKARSEKKIRETACTVNQTVHEHPWSVIGAVTGGALAVGLIVGLKKNHSR